MIQIHKKSTEKQHNKFIHYLIIVLQYETFFASTTDVVTQLIIFLSKANMLRILVSRNC